MKINEITLHNFRSVKEQTFALENYSLLVGANNSGKTNIIDALRIFYEKDLKYAHARDFPKFATEDKESWIEIQYVLPESEFCDLKDGYKQPCNTLRVRKYLNSSDPIRVKANQSNIYGYEEGDLSENLFYGARNISAAKLGDVIYIPEVTKADDYTKLTGPSAFRNLLTFVVSRVVKNSPAFNDLSVAFEDFDGKFKEEASKDGFSLQNLVNDINTELSDWDTSFGIEINAIKPEVIVKSFVTHYLQDANLKEKNGCEFLWAGFSEASHLYPYKKMNSDWSQSLPATKKPSGVFHK